MSPQLISVVVFLASFVVDTNGVAPKFDVGKSYTFDYNSEMCASSKGVWRIFTGRYTNDVLTVETKAKVVVRGLSESEYLLILSDGQLKTRRFLENVKDNSTGSIQMDLDSSVTKFTFVDGQITSTFNNPDEPVWYANIKRAVLSLLQNKAFSPSMDKSVEIEDSVLGRCLTKYDTTTSDVGTVYRKEINLDECGLSEGSDIISQGVPYQIPLVVNKPLFSVLRLDPPVVECRQNVSKELTLISSVCAANGSLAGYSYGNFDGDSYQNYQKHKHESSLTFAGSSEAPPPHDPLVANLTLRSSSLLHDFISCVRPTEEGQKMAIHKLKLLLFNEPRSDAHNELSYFNEYKSLIPQVSDWAALKNSEKYPQFKLFLAAAEIVTDSAISLLVQAHKAKEQDLRSSIKMTFYGNLPFVAKPGIKAMEELTELVNDVKVPQLPETKTKETLRGFAEEVSLTQHLLLGVSGAAYRFCTRTEVSCANSSQYTALVNAIAKHVNVASKEAGESGVTLGALFALGNVNYLTSDAVKKLESLISAAATSVPVRLAALDAFRRDPCQRQLKDLVRSKLVDKTGTDELRIHAYLAAVKCLTEDDISAVKRVLDETENNFVKGFIASHIKNIMASTSPSTAGMRASLSAIEVPASTSSIQDIPRASKFVEHSTFRQKENVGFSGSMTVFFAPGQTCPQFVSFNKTLDVFGRSYNFIEVGLSHRMVPTDRAFHGESEPPNWMAMHRALEAKDSYIRVCGTTVAMGKEGLHKAAVLFSPLFKLSNDKFMSFQMGTLLDAKLSISTLTGLPVTFGLNSTYLSDLEVEMSDEPLQKLMSLFLGPEMGKDSNLTNVKLNARLDASAALVASAIIGGDSPLRVGYAMEGRLDEKWAVGVEASSNAQNINETAWSFKLSFPDVTIFSTNMTGNVYTVQEINGDRMERSTTAVSSKITDAKCISYEMLGIKSCVNVTRPDNSFDAFPTTVSIKTRIESFSLLVISSRKNPGDGSLREGVTFVFSTSDSSPKRELKVDLNRERFRHPQTREKWTEYNFDLTREVGEAQFRSLIKINSSMITPSLTWELSRDFDFFPEKLVDIKAVLSRPPQQDVKFKATFGGFLKRFVEDLNASWKKTFANESESVHTFKMRMNSRLMSVPVNLKSEFRNGFEDVGADRKKFWGLVNTQLIVGHERLELLMAANSTLRFGSVSEVEGRQGRHPRAYVTPENIGYSGSVRYFKTEQLRRSRGVAVEMGISDDKEFNGRRSYNGSGSLASTYIVENSWDRPADNWTTTVLRGEVKGEVGNPNEFNGTVEVSSVSERNETKKLGNLRFEVNAPTTLNVGGEFVGILEFNASASASTSGSQKANIQVNVNASSIGKSCTVGVEIEDAHWGSIPATLKSFVKGEVNTESAGKPTAVKFSNEVTYNATVEPEFSAQGWVSTVGSLGSKSSDFYENTVEGSQEVTWSVEKRSWWKLNATEISNEVVRYRQFYKEFYGPQEKELVYLGNLNFDQQQKNFVFHREVEVKRMNVTQTNEKFLVHLSVQLREDEFQKRLEIQTDHNFCTYFSDFPGRRMNLTVSR